MIKAKEYIESGFSSEDATKLDSAIKPLFEAGEDISVDFEDISIFTTLFFNNAFAKYLMLLGPEEYDKRFVLNNLSELGEMTYKHSLDNAKHYYSLSEENKTTEKDIVENLE